MKGCKGLCSRVKTGRPFGDPYPTHALCRRCQIWIKHEDLIPHEWFNLVCPCCKARPKMKSYRSKKTQMLTKRL